MPTTRFCSVIGVPERTWRRHQARARQAAAQGAVATAGPRPGPRGSPPTCAGRPAWGHRKVWAMCRYDGLPVSAATVLRLLREEGLLLEANYQRERRQLAERRKAAFADEPIGPNQVWQLDFTEFETTTGGTWRLAGCRDYWPSTNRVPRVADREPARRHRRSRIAFDRSEQIVDDPISEIASPTPGERCRW